MGSVPLLRRLYLYLLVGTFTVVAVSPFYLIVGTAFKTNSEIAQAPLAPPSSFHWENIANAWTVGRFGTYARNSIFISISTTVLVLAVSVLAGYALSRLNLPGQKVVSLFFLLGMAVPVHGIIIPQFLLMRRLHLLAMPIGVTLVLTAIFIPFGIYFMRSFFASLPSEVSDAARMDGCSELQVLLHVMGPMAWPAIATLLVFIFMWAWNDLLVSLVYLSDDSVRTVMVGLTLYQGRFTVDTSLTATGALIAIVPVVLVYMIFQRQFLEGIASGAVAAG